MNYQKEKLRKQSTSSNIKIIKIPRNNYKKIKDLYWEIYKALIKVIEDNTNRWKDVPYSWIGIVNIVETTVLLKAIYRFNKILITIQMAFFKELLHVRGD